jgi:hypothetical protein
MKMLSKRTVQASARDDPTLKNYLKLMDEFLAEAKAEPAKNFL